MPLVKIRIESFSWTFPDGETVVWNITKAKQIVSDGRLPEHRIPLADMRVVFDSNTDTRSIDDKYALTRDLSQPIIAAVMEINGDNIQLQIIDGWHRIRKAILTNTESLPCVVLLPSEERACRIAPETLLLPV